jgi:DNA polymerase III epsilon subunit-like protein
LFFLYLKMNDILISVDIETTGPSPILHSMISLGACAFTFADGITNDFKININEYNGRSVETMKFWDENIDKWNEIKESRDVPKKDLKYALQDFKQWMFSLRKDPKQKIYLVAYPTLRC